MRETRDKHHSSLRAVRQAAGLTQEALAEKISTSKPIIENVEMGRTVLSEELASRVSALFGVVPESLYDGTNPLSFSGKPLTKQAVEDWQSMTYSAQDAGHLIKATAGLVGMMLAATLYRTRGEQKSHLFRELVMEVNQFVFDKAKQHDLFARAKQHAEQNALRVTGQPTVGELRAAWPNDEQWKAIDDPRWPDSMPVNLVQTTTAIFEPCVGFKQGEGPTVFRDFWIREKNHFALTIKGKSFSVTRYAFVERTLGPVPEALKPPSQPPSPTPPPAVESPKTSRPRRASPVAGKPKK